MTIKVAVNGAAGRMGRTVTEVIALSDAVELAAAYDCETSPAVAATPEIRDVQALDAAVFDVLIDFSIPDGALAALERCAAAGKSAVVGTTGFDGLQQERIKVLSASMPLVIAPNMSMGMNMCFRLIRRTAEVLGNEADVEIIESHHRYKVDSPSGTAIRMGEVIAEALDLDLSSHAVYGRRGHTGVRPDHAIGFHSIRGGDVFGEHRALFSFAGEQIEIRHKASSRLAFARGAVSAAVWVAGREPGRYRMEDVLEL